MELVMTETDARDINNHLKMFGSDSVVRKLGRKWTVQFRSFGYPGCFNTKREAIEWAMRWRPEAA